MRNAMIAAGVAAGIAAAATTAQAQDATAGKKLNYGVEVGVHHDSNYARSSKTVADARGIDRSETITTPALWADINLPLSRQTFFLHGSAGYDFYANNDSLNSVHFDISSGLGLKLNLCTGGVNVDYNERQSDFNDLSLLATKNVQANTSASVDMMCGRATGFAPSLRASTSSITNSASPLQATDSDNNRYELGLAYRRPSLGVITVFGARSEVRYHDATAGNLLNENYDTDSLGIRYDRHLGARIGGSVAVSYTHTKPDSILTPDFEGWTYNGQVDYRVNSRLQAQLSFTRDVQPTIRPGASYSVSNATQLTANYAIGSRIKLSGGLSFIDSNYKGFVISGPQLTEEQINSIFAEATVGIGRHFSLAGDVRYEERDANVAGLDYSSVQVGVRAIGKF